MHLIAKYKLYKVEAVSLRAAFSNGSFVQPSCAHTQVVHDGADVTSTIVVGVGDQVVGHALYSFVLANSANEVMGDTHWY